MEDVSPVSSPRPSSPLPPPARGSAQRRQRHSLAALACLAVAMLLRPHLAFGEDEGRWSDGTWTGDEGSLDEDREDRDATLSPRSSPSMADFQESLNPYGQWIETPEYGLVWRPAAADDG